MNSWNPDKLTAAFDPELWHRFKLTHHEFDTYFSHAGLHPRLFPFQTFNEEWLQRMETYAIRDAYTFNGFSLLTDPFGPLWCRSLPDFGIRQVFGHTRVPDIRVSNRNVNCDCAHTFLGLIDGENFYRVRRADNSRTLLFKMSN